MVGWLRIPEEDFGKKNPYPRPHRRACRCLRRAYTRTPLLPALVDGSGDRGDSQPQGHAVRFGALIARLRAEHADLDEFLGRAGRNSPFLQARRKIKLMLAREREHERK